MEQAGQPVQPLGRAGCPPHKKNSVFVEQAGQPVHGEWYTAVSLTGLGDRAKIHQFSTQPQRVLNLLCKRMETKHDQNNCL